MRHVGLPGHEARAAMPRRGMPEFHADALIGVARAYRNGGAETTPGELEGSRPQSRAASASSMARAVSDAS